MSGKIIRNGEDTTIDVRDICAGIYLLTVNTGTGQFLTKVVIEK